MSLKDIFFKSMCKNTLKGGWYLYSALRNCIKSDMAIEKISFELTAKWVLLLYSYTLGFLNYFLPNSSWCKIKRKRSWTDFSAQFYGVFAFFFNSYHFGFSSAVTFCNMLNNKNKKMEEIDKEQLKGWDQPTFVVSRRNAFFINAIINFLVTIQLLTLLLSSLMPCQCNHIVMAGNHDKAWSN